MLGCETGEDAVPKQEALVWPHLSTGGFRLVQVFLQTSQASLYLSQQ